MIFKLMKKKSRSCLDDKNNFAFESKNKAEEKKIMKQILYVEPIKHNAA